MAATAARRVVQLVSQPQAQHSYSRSACSNADLLITGIKFRVHPVAACSLPLFIDKRYGSEVLIRMAPSIAWNNAARRFETRSISQLVKSNGKRAFLVDTLALVRRLEAQGMPSKQAEAITAAITEVLNDSLENVAQSFVSKAEMQRSEMMQESAFSKFKTEMQSSEMMQESALSKFKTEMQSSEMMQESALSKFKTEMQSSQDHHFSVLQHVTEKLRTDIDKMRSELRYEIDKVTAGQRLDLNLERGRIRDELANQNSETSNLTNKLDREIHAVKTQLEAAKYDVIKYCIGTIVSVTAVGLGLLRIFM